MKTWIESNIRRIQDGMIGLFAGFIVTNQDIGLVATMLIVATFLTVVAYTIGIK